MRILHTSDWHLGRTLYGKKRYDEFEQFLTWLAEQINQLNIDVLLVAGDVFDTTAPSNRSQELYYQFLCKVAASPCRYVVIIAGNHDSPSFLEAPKALLKALHVYVIGSTTDDLENEVLVLGQAEQAPELIVGAVPYLRDKEVRQAEAGETFEDKERKLLQGICSHYAKIGALAAQKRQQSGLAIPVVGMGHLFTAGGATVDGDGVRDLYVGSLAQVSANCFPESFNYLALGHLHVPQKVGGSETIRYSGSPLPMGFGEATQQKSICLIEFTGLIPSVQLVEVPLFRTLRRIKGDWEHIAAELKKLQDNCFKGWLEIIHEGSEVLGDLRQRIEALNNVPSPLEILRIKNNRVIDGILEQSPDGETLDTLNVHEVFNRCLVANRIPEMQRQELVHSFNEILTMLADADPLAQ